MSRLIYVIKFPMNSKYRRSHRWCSLNKIFWKTLQYSQEKLQASRLATLLKRYSNTGVFLWILQTLITPISKNICEWLLLVAVIYSIENWTKLFRNQIGLLFLLKHKITLFYLLSFVFIRFITRCHSLLLIVFFFLLVVIRCHSLSFIVTCYTTSCHSLYPSLSFVVTRCTTRLSFYKRSIEITEEEKNESAIFSLSQYTSMLKASFYFWPFIKMK